MKLKRVLLTVALLALLALCSCGTKKAASKDEPAQSNTSVLDSGGGSDKEDLLGSHSTGLAEPTIEEMKEIATRQVVGAAEYTSLPNAYDNSSNYPTPGDQGQQGSCVGWATAYALRSLQEQEERHWGYSDDHLFSPSFVYNLGNGGVDGGISIAAGLKILENYGAATLDVMPYNERDYKTQPGDGIKNMAWENRIASWSSIQGINDIKEAILNYGGALVGVPIYPEFDYINENNPIYDDSSGKTRGGHAICLVGWDNDLQAFKFINSWGTEWGVNGFAWVSYEIATSYGFAYYMVDRREDTNNDKKVYTIKFEPVGGSESMENIILEDGVGQTLRRYPGTKAGYTLRGWFLAKEGDGEYLYHYWDPASGKTGWYVADENPSGYKPFFVNDGAEILIKDLEAGTYVLIAGWSENEVINKLTISFDANGGYGYMSDLNIIDRIVRLPNSSFTNDGYEFGGWHVEYDGEYWHRSEDGTQSGWYPLNEAPSNYQPGIIEDGGTFEIRVTNGTVTLEAIWEPLGQITIYVGVFEDDVLTHIEETLEIGESFSMSENLVTERDGRTFIGWSMFDMNKGQYKYEYQGMTAWYAEGDEPSGYEMFMHQPNESYEGFSHEYAGREFLMLPEYEYTTMKELIYYKYHIDAKIPDFINFGGGFTQADSSVVAGLLEVYAYVSTADSDTRKAAINDYIDALEANDYTRATDSNDKWWSTFANKQYEIEKELFGDSLEVTAFVSDEGAVLISSYRNYVALALYSKDDKKTVES
jgi:hypothetical protein